MPQIEMQDRVSLDDANIRMTGDGYLIATPRIARTGIQLYRGSEVHMDDKTIVRVYRPEQEVFHKDHMHSLAFRPVTDDHPREMVTSDNWKKYAVGSIGDEVARDGEFIRVPIVLMDQAVIDKVRDGKSELSVGYMCDLKFEDGVTPDGEKYDAIQTNIRANHLAVVDAARGGVKLRIGDDAGKRVNMTVLADAMAAIQKGEIEHDASISAKAVGLTVDNEYPILDGERVNVRGLGAAKKLAADAKDREVSLAIDALLSLIEDAHTEEPSMKNHTIDGVSVEMSDTAVQVVERHTKTINDARTAAEKALADATAKFDADKKALEDQVAKLTADAANATAKITALEKQVSDAAITPAKLDQMVKDREVVAKKAHALIGDKLVVDGKTDGEIRKQVVGEKLGDAAKDYSDDQIKIAFDTLTASVDVNKVDHVAAAFAQPHVNDSRTKSDAAYEDRNKRLQDAWKGPAARA